MKILIRNSDSLVFYAQDDLVLDTEAHGDNWRDPNFNSTNATIIEATLPRGWINATWSYIDGVWVVVNLTRYTALLNAEIATFILRIDADADALIRTTIGERASQYAGAEGESLAYQAAGYTGTVPPKVQAWATAKNQTAAWAANSQIAAAATWRSAENALYATRLLLKEAARAATGAAELDTIKIQWATFMAALYKPNAPTI
jgi:hypothetical protein